MTDEFILDCEAFDLVGEAMFTDSWRGTGIQVQPGTLFQYGYDPFAEASYTEMDKEQHKLVRAWLNRRGFIGQKFPRAKFEASLDVAFFGSPQPAFGDTSIEEAEMKSIAALPITNGNSIVEGTIKRAARPSAPPRPEPMSRTGTVVSGATPGRRQPSRERAKKALEALYQGKIPDQDSEPNKILCGKVGAWLENSNLPEVKTDTILRAAGRRK
jgi:hypothetical protein